MCGLILPPLRWWQWISLVGPPPFHDPAGKYGDRCWRGFMRRLGQPIDTPKPWTYRRPSPVRLIKGLARNNHT